MKKNKHDTKIAESKTPQSFPKWYYALLAGIPFLFFFLLETGLRVFDYGVTYEVFVELSDYYPDVLFLNPEITGKYFPDLKNTPGTIADGFAREKAENSYRVFVLGESSAAGWPYIPNASFPRYLKRRLELTYPERTIEVINLGISAICTYTIRDILPEVVKQKPDLVLIYTGHNEYYGALGAGSTQSLGNSRSTVNFLLSLQDFRTVQLVQNIIKWVWGTVQPKEAAGGQNETLMAKVIGENIIPLDSETYKAGIGQFEGNMRDIITQCKNNHIPVVIGTLACNLKDLQPFASAASGENAGAIYKRARQLYDSAKYTEAKAMFYAAKDADALRFRAPSAINQSIVQLSREFSLPLVNIDSALNAHCNGGIAGSELMVDHLHPNTRGYELIGKSFWETMSACRLLPQGKTSAIAARADSILTASFPFTALDSVIADIRIRILTGGYPFTPRGQKNLLIENFHPLHYRDSLAMLVIDKDITLEDAHYRLADRCYAAKDYTAFEKELLVLIADREINPTHYRKLCKGFIDAGMYDRAMPYLKKLDAISSDAYSNKWIGAIYLQSGNSRDAQIYLERSAALEADDPQVWYNLSGAYYNNGNVNKSLDAIKQCLRVNPRYQSARDFYFQLRRAYGVQ